MKTCNVHRRFDRIEEEQDNLVILVQDLCGEIAALREELAAMSKELAALRAERRCRFVPAQTPAPPTTYPTPYTPGPMRQWPVITWCSS